MFLYFPANICGPCFTPFVGLHGNALFRKSSLKGLNIYSPWATPWVEECVSLHDAYALSPEWANTSQAGVSTPVFKNKIE